MEIIIAKQNRKINIKNGWLENFLLPASVQCDHCLKEFGPCDEDMINYESEKEDSLGWICGKCARRLAHPYLKEMKIKTHTHAA